METDKIKMISTYLLALIVVCGGFVLLYLTKDDPTSALALAVAGFIGSALTFAFGAESATRASRAADRTTTATVAAVLTPPPVLPPAP